MRSTHHCEPATALDTALLGASGVWREQASTQQKAEYRRRTSSSHLARRLAGLDLGNRWRLRNPRLHRPSRVKHGKRNQAVHRQHSPGNSAHGIPAWHVKQAMPNRTWEQQKSNYTFTHAWQRRSTQVSRRDAPLKLSPQTPAPIRGSKQRTAKKTERAHADQIGRHVVGTDAMHHTLHHPQREHPLPTVDIKLSLTWHRSKRGETTKAAEAAKDTAQRIAQSPCTSA